MRRFIYFFLFLLSSASVQVFAQTNSTKDDSNPFNYSYWSAVADKKQLSGKEREEFLDAHKRTSSEEPQPENNHNYNTPVYNFSIEKSAKGGQNNILAGPCTNIGFEAGN